MKTAIENERFLTTSQAAKISRVTRFTVANWAKSGLLKVSYTAGGHRRISQESLEEFIRTHCKARPADAKTSKYHRMTSIIEKSLYSTGKFIGKFHHMVAGGGAYGN